MALSGDAASALRRRPCGRPPPAPSDEALPEGPGASMGETSAGHWVGLFVIARVVTFSTALVMLLVPEGGGSNAALGLIGAAYGLATIALVKRWPALSDSRLAWSVDAAATLGLIAASQNWRSPFYLMALSALVLPASGLGLRWAMSFGLAFTVSYMGVGVVSGMDWEAVRTTPLLQSYVSHIAVPLLITLALTYSAGILSRLEEEHGRAERLAVEAERRRIGWELHDSAKQRVHAAHLLLSALRPGEVRPEAPYQQALRELQAAEHDLDTSVNELSAPLPDGRTLVDSLRARADELSAATDASVEVTGEDLAVSALVGVHVYRIASEALTNAMRHARAERIVLDLRGSDGLVLSVTDDGGGIEGPPRPGAKGMRSMRSRARAIGGTLTVRDRDGGSGTVVELHVPGWAGSART